MIYFELFYTFFLIGLFTFGGGYAMIPMIQEQVVGKGWIEGNALTDFIAISETTPGPFAQRGAGCRRRPDLRICCRQRCGSAAEPGGRAASFRQ